MKKSKPIKKLSMYLVTAQIASFVFFNNIALAGRAEAEQSLKNEGKAALNAFTNVFQYLSGIVAVLAFVVVLFGGLLVASEEEFKKTKKIATFVLVAAFISTIVSFLVTLATNT